MAGHVSWGRAQQENTGRENLGNTREASSEAPPNLSFQWSKDLALSDKRGQFKVTGLKASWLGSAECGETIPVHSEGESGLQGA